MGQSLNTESAPQVGAIQLLSHLHSDFKVTTFKRKLEAGLGILNELQGDLRIALLLKIRDNALTNQAGGLDDLEHFVVVPLDQGKLETVFGGVDLQDLGFSVTVKAIDVASLNLDKVDGLVKGTDNTVIAAECLSVLNYG